MRNNNSNPKININQSLEPKTNQISLAQYQCKYDAFINKNNKDLKKEVRQIIVNNAFGYNQSQSFTAKNISQSHYRSAIFNLKDLNPLIELNIIEKPKAIFLQASENNIINRNHYNKILEKINKK